MTCMAMKSSDKHAHPRCGHDSPVDTLIVLVGFTERTAHPYLYISRNPEDRFPRADVHMEQTQELFMQNNEGNSH